MTWIGTIITMTTMMKMVFFIKYEEDGDNYYNDDDDYFRYQVMLKCWQEQPDDRPSFEQLRHELKLMENQHKVIKRIVNLAISPFSISPSIFTGTEIRTSLIIIF